MSPRRYVGLILLLVLGSLAGQRWLHEGGVQSLPPTAGDHSLTSTALTQVIDFQERLMPYTTVTDWRGSLVPLPQKEKKRGSPCMAWVIYGTTQDSGEVHFVIDSTSGKLLQFSRAFGTAQSDSHATTPPKKAASIAKRFLCSIDPEENGYRWHLNNIEPPKNGAWHVYLQRRSTIAHIAIFDASGELMWFRLTNAAPRKYVTKNTTSRDARGVWPSNDGS